MNPYSKDLRLRVLAAVDRGTPRDEVARTFSVSVPTIKRWLRRRRETGGVESRPIPGRPSVKGAALGGWLPSHLRSNDDLTLEAPNTFWKMTKIANWYGSRERTVEISSETAVWYSTGLFAVPMRWVLVHDPQGQFNA